VSEQRDCIEKIIKSHEPSIIGSDDTINTAVLIPLTDHGQSGTEIIFQKRADHLDIQPGDVCFPGGFKDSNDESFRETALRETSEELGLSVESITMIDQYDSMIIPWSITIQSFVGWVETPELIEPDRSEVAEVFRVPIEVAIDQEPDVHEVDLVPKPGEDFPYERIPGGEDYDWRPRQLPELFYEFNGRHVWGITARILNRFLESLRDQLD
jgi:8-oxo-dGTP pyrophosphatase MutT (NUDIX family)